MHPALQGLITIIVGVGGCVGYFYFSNQFLDKVLFPATRRECRPQHQPGQPDPALAVPVSRTVRARPLSRLSGV
jgi:hypothetical protein